MIGNGKFVYKNKDIEVLCGGEGYLLTDADIEKLKRGAILNIFVSEEYGCYIKHIDAAPKEEVIMIAEGSCDLDRLVKLEDEKIEREKEEKRKKREKDEECDKAIKNFLDNMYSNEKEGILKNMMN